MLGIITPIESIKFSLSRKMITSLQYKHEFEYNNISEAPV